jgi:hypothetical protein
LIELKNLKKVEFKNIQAKKPK